MIQGQFGSKGELFFEIDLISSDGLFLTVDAILDTGFTGFLAINRQDVDSLTWSFIDREVLRTAQGESLFDIYTGRVLLNGQEFEIPVYVGEQITEILLGSQWLLTFSLVAKFQEGLLTLG
jgi:clan AA aspartic protease